MDDKAGDVFDGVGKADDIHLRPGDHHVAHLHVGNLQGTFDDRQGIRVEHVAVVGRMQKVQQFVPVFRLPGEEGGKPFEQGWSTTRGFHKRGG